MTFTTLQYFAFLIPLLFFFHLPLPWLLRKCVLCVASYLFYAASEPWYVLLLLASSVCDWWAAKAIAASASERTRKYWFAGALSVNIALLGFFKYGPFFWETAGRVIGCESPFPFSAEIPAGISFYTFQTMSYTIDVYRRRLEPARSVVDYFLFVSFFPQLVAGPIVRANEFIPQLQRPPLITGKQCLWGTVLLTIGLLQKTYFADTVLAPFVERVYETPSDYAPLAVWAGTFAFCGQLYFDFSAYSLCAIGSAKLFGFELPINFAAPYSARTISEYWRRWHISLSSWLKDYLFIPLVQYFQRRQHFQQHHQLATTTYNNFEKKTAPTSSTIPALFITFAVSGLWHGAAWSYVLWGMLHGVMVVVERIGASPATSKSGAVLQNARTLLLLVVSFVLFRAGSVSEAIDVWQVMFGGGLSPVMPWDPDATIAVALTCGLIVWHNITRGVDFQRVLLVGPRCLEQPWTQAISWVLWLGSIVLLGTYGVFSAERPNAFMYFRF